MTFITLHFIITNNYNHRLHSLVLLEWRLSSPLFSPLYFFDLIIIIIIIKSTIEMPLHWIHYWHLALAVRVGGSGCASRGRYFILWRHFYIQFPYLRDIYELYYVAFEDNARIILLSILIRRRSRINKLQFPIITHKNTNTHVHTLSLILTQFTSFVIIQLMPFSVTKQTEKLISHIHLCKDKVL